MHLDVVPSRSVALPAETGTANVLEKAVADFIGDISHSLPSASHAVNAPSHDRKDEDKPSAVDQDPPSSGVATHALVAPSVAEGAVLSKAKSVNGTHSPLLMTHHPRRPHLIGRTNLLLRLGVILVASSVRARARSVKRGPKSVMKSEKTGRQSKVVPSPEMIKIKIFCSPRL